MSAEAAGGFGSLSSELIEGSIVSGRIAATDRIPEASIRDAAHGDGTWDIAELSLRSMHPLSE